jgi:predicted nucleotide-binding protein
MTRRPPVHANACLARDPPDESGDDGRKPFKYYPYVSRPTVFVASSLEGLNFARAIRSLLADDAEVSVWRESIFGVGDTTIDSLLNALPRFDFAVFVLSPEDATTSRGRTVESPRDNVIFELGLFMGKLGRSRVFMVRPRDIDIKIPSDVLGITPTMYDWPRASNSERDAVGAACDDIRQAIRSLGPAEHRLNAALNVVTSVQERQQHKIDALTFIVSHFLPKFEYEHLQKLASEDPFPYEMQPGFERELRTLWGLYFIDKRDPKSSIAALPRRGNLRDFFFITEEGKTYLRLRADAEQQRRDDPVTR